MYLPWEGDDGSGEVVVVVVYASRGQDWVRHAGRQHRAAIAEI